MYKRQLRPGCADFGASDRRAFSAGVPRQTLFDNVLGPGLRVACRDTAARIHALEEFRPDDAPTAFAVVRFDPTTERFDLHHADARTRIALAENFLLFRRYDVAAACFDAAHATGGENAVLDYLRTAANAAARHPVAASEPLALRPDSLTAILLARATAVRSEADRAPIRALAAAVLDQPTDAAPHAALGREVLAVGNPRQGAIELSIAFGIAGAASDLVTLARAYEAMGALEEARAAYEQAIALGLPPAERSHAEQRRESIDPTLPH